MSSHPPAEDGRASDRVEDLPELYREALREAMINGETVECLVFIASDTVRSTRVPAAALVATDLGVLALRESDDEVGDARWGIQTTALPYANIGAITLGHVLLRGHIRIRLFAPSGNRTERDARYL